MRRGPTTSSERGQALVEFALILPVFVLVLFSVVEFGFVMNASNTLNYVSRVGAMLAAEGGQTAGTDCIILSAIERELTSPATPTRVSRIDIYWSDANGAQLGSNANTYTRSGSTTCSFADGTSVTVPYTLSSPGYTEDERCDVLLGCGGGHTTVDTIGVRITYTHQWVTAFGRNIAGPITFQRSTAVRMEPTL